MSRYARVQLGTTYLTSDGTSDGRPCKVSVPNEAAFASSFGATPQTAADGTIYVQTVNRGVQGIEFFIVAEHLAEAVLAQIITQLNTGLSSGAGVRVIVDSLTDFDVMAMPLPDEAGQLFTFESRSGGYARGVRVRFISIGAGA